MKSDTPIASETDMSRGQLPTESGILSMLRLEEIKFDPYSITILTIDAADQLQGKRTDAVLQLSWEQESLPFAAECKRFLTAKSLDNSIGQAKQNAATRDILPLVITSFLGRDAISKLEAEKVSGIDLCGNGVVIVPGKWLVVRSGEPNRFRSESAIKNVYRRTSSVVARLFLAYPQIPSVQDALDELTRRGGRVTLATVSKVCKALADDLVIEKTRDGATRLKLLQPEKLLDLLAENFIPPEAGSRLTGKFRGETAELLELLTQWEAETGGRVVLTGPSSVSSYAVMAREDAQSFYCSRIDSLVKYLGERFQRTDRFATLTLLETRDDTVYFDRRQGLLASPVQTFLELWSGDKRDRETADQVRRVVLDEVARADGGK